MRSTIAIASRCGFSLDGTAIRDYLHVMDLAEVHLAALRYLNASGPRAAFNLGTGHGTGDMYRLNRGENRK